MLRSNPTNPPFLVGQQTWCYAAQSNHNSPVKYPMNAKLFLHSVLQDFYSALHTVQQHNYDSRRFSYDGVDRSNIFQNEQHAAYMELFTEQYEAFFQSWLLLRDEESRRLFMRLILFRLLGHLHIRISDGASSTSELALYTQASHWKTRNSELPVTSILGPLSHYAGIPFDHSLLQADCADANVVYSFIKKQYFFSRGAVRIQPEAGETVIDAGACLGDSTLAFSARVGPSGRVYSFDPLPTHVTVSNHNIGQNGFEDRAMIVPMGVGNLTNHVDKRIQSDHGVSPGFSMVGSEANLPMVTLDDFAAAENLQRLDFIKMDIEGSEFAALEGALNCLTRFQPKLAISLYHRPEDFITIPQFLATVLPNYDFYLDHYTMHQEETVLYARPSAR